jgi:hypothetical protein
MVKEETNRFETSAKYNYPSYSWKHFELLI